MPGLAPSVVFGGAMMRVAVGMVSVVWPDLVQLGNLAHLSPPNAPEWEAVV